MAGAHRVYQRDTNQTDQALWKYPLMHVAISYQNIISFDKKLDIEWTRDGKSLCNLSGSILHLKQKTNDIVLKSIAQIKNQQTKMCATLNLYCLNFSLWRSISTLMKMKMMMMMMIHDRNQNSMVVEEAEKSLERARGNSRQHLVSGYMGTYTWQSLLNLRIVQFKQSTEAFW